VELYLHSPNTPSWRGAQFKKSTVTTLPLPFTTLPLHLNPYMFLSFGFLALSTQPRLSENRDMRRICLN